MKRLALLFALIFLCNEVKSQYCNIATTNVAITPTTTNQTTAAYNSGRRAFNFSATAGCTYYFETCGLSTADTYLRLYSTGTGGTVLATGDDNCGTQSAITWTCSTSGTYSILMTNWSCAALTVSTSLRYRITGCVTPYNPCSSIANISGCGISTGVVFSSGNGAYNPPSTTCGFSTPGKEKIFTFTPSVTGNYSISQPSSFGYIDWFYKASSSGCSGTGWTCIDDISNANTGNANVSIPLTAGVQYYLMADPESTIGGNVTFIINCPVAPPANDLVCNATTITCGSSTAGTTINSTNSDTGEGGSCGVAQSRPGVWYKVTGTGDLMTASLCATAWDSKISVYSGSNCTSLTCIGGNDDNGPSCAGSSASYTWTSVVGLTYYILVHGYSGESAFNLSLTCTVPPTPGPCTNTTAYGALDFPTQITPIQTISCSYAGEYSTWTNPEVNVTYIITSSNVNDWITVRMSVFNGSVLSSGNTPLSITIPESMIYYIHVNSTNICGTESVCRNVSVERISALPVEMIYFEGKSSGDYNLLQWATASEYNADYFSIETSLTGIDWDIITNINCTGWSNEEIKYYYNHKFDRSELNYYRLIQYDNDGYFDIYGPIVIDNRKVSKKIIKHINLMGQEVNPYTEGVILVVYEDGTIEKILK